MTTKKLIRHRRWAFVQIGLSACVALVFFLFAFSHTNESFHTRWLEAMVGLWNVANGLNGALLLVRTNKKIAARQFQPAA